MRAALLALMLASCAPTLAERRARCARACETWCNGRPECTCRYTPPTADTFGACEVEFR